MKDKIIIIDDDSTSVLLIISRIKEKFGDAFEIYPDDFGSSQISDKLDFIISNFRNFDSIRDIVLDNQLIIIDKCLEGTDDKLGIELAEKILSSEPEARILIISKNKLDDDITKKYKNVSFISKIEKTNHNNSEIINYITNNLNWQEVPATSNSKDNSNPKKSNKSKKDNKFYNYLDNIEKHSRFIVDSFINFSFYFIMITIIYYSAKDLSFTFAERPKKEPDLKSSNHSQIKKPEGKVVEFINNQHHESKKEEEVTKIIEKAEYVFLYLLPIFIVFGFYIFYYNYIRQIFLDGGIKTGTELFSISAINHTKTIFISTVISFIVVKIIDILIQQEDTHFPTAKIISLGALLIVLMSFYIITNNHNKHNKNDSNNS